MTRKNSSRSGDDVQGVALIELVIEHVQSNPRCIAGFCNDYPLLAPRPFSAEVIEALRFPNGKELSPSLKRWLAFDSSWLTSLGWFHPSTPTLFTPRSVDEIVRDEFGDFWEEVYRLAESSLLQISLDEIAGEEIFEPREEHLATCFLLPEGTDSRRVYTVSEPDSLGEYPVLVVDMDDIPYLGLMYPGFDVYMADLAGIIEFSWGTYTDLFDDPRYAGRLQSHADTLFNGKRDTDFADGK